MRTFVPRFLWALAALVALTVFGTMGYRIIEHPALTDAFYMTVITLTAVGYQEVWELSPAGRGFTMTLLLGGITWLGFWFAIVTSLIVELDLKDALRKRRTTKEVVRMEGHIIICGVGRTGRQVAQELDDAGSDVVLVERDPARIKTLREYLPDALVVEGDATHDQILLEAGLVRAKGLITCLSADTDNLFVCLSARDMVAGLTIIARAYEEESIDKLYRAGADQVVSPNFSSAVRMASMVLRPSVISFVDILTRSPRLALRMEQLRVDEGATVSGQTLAEARIPEQTGLVIIAIHKAGPGGGDLMFNPSASTRIEAGDEVIVLGGDEQLERLRAFVH